MPGAPDHGLAAEVIKRCSIKQLLHFHKSIAAFASNGSIVFLYERPGTRVREAQLV
jgi:hypothetical protein